MTPARPVPAEITSLVAQILEIDAGLVTPDVLFTDLGRTSLQEIELLTAIEDRYRITLDFGTFVDLKTVGDLSIAVAAATGR